MGILMRGLSKACLCSRVPRLKMVNILFDGRRSKGPDSACLIPFFFLSLGRKRDSGSAKLTSGLCFK